MLTVLIICITIFCTFVVDIPNGFNVMGLEDLIEINEELKETTVAKGDTINMECGASVYNYTDQIGWFKDSQLIEDLEYNRKNKSNYKNNYFISASLRLHHGKESHGLFVSC